MGGEQSSCALFLWKCSQILFCFSRVLFLPEEYMAGNEITSLGNSERSLLCPQRSQSYIVRCVERYHQHRPHINTEGKARSKIERMRFRESDMFLKVDKRKFSLSWALSEWKMGMDLSDFFVNSMHLIIPIYVALYNFPRFFMSLLGVGVGGRRKKVYFPSHEYLMSLNRIRMREWDENMVLKGGLPPPSPSN